MAANERPESLTKHLTGKFSPLFERATKHPFLAAAGNGTLPAPTLCRWLGQDIIYTRAYIRFIGSLLSRLQLPEQPLIHGPHQTAHLHLRAMNLLIDSITNLQREIKFFDETIAKYSLTIEVSKETASVKPEPVTQAYADLFDSFCSPSHSLLEGLLTLWATEYAYLTAWKWARSHMTEQQHSTESEDISVEQLNSVVALREAFIPNWSSPEFAVFVEECRKLVDDLWTSMLSDESGPLSTTEMRLLQKCERVFENNIRLEEGFWPS